MTQANGNGVRTAIMSAVAFVWVINMVAPMFMSDYKPPAAVNAAFMLVIGAICATYKSEAKRPITEPEIPPAKKPAKKAAPRKKAPAKKARP